MAEPTLAQITLIKARFNLASLSDDEVVSQGNAPTIPNPVPQPTVPSVVLSTNLLSKLSPASAAKASRNQGFPEMHADIKAGRRPEMKEWAQWFLLCGDITQAEYTNIMGVIDATMPDPLWKANISWAQVNLGRPIDTADVWTARRTP